MNIPTYELVDILHSPQRQQGDVLPCIQDITKKQEGVDIHPSALNILQKSFLLGILGKPGSGKSTIIEHLITNQKFYSGKFERILYVGPTRYNNISSFSPIIQDDFNSTNGVNAKWLFERIQQSNGWQCQNMLIVFDDVITHMKQGASNRYLQQLFFNRRHLLHKGCISIIVTSQKWTSFPKFIRTGITSLIMFGTTKYQAQSVWKQSSISLSRSNFCFLVNQLKPHENIYINFTSGKIFNSKWQQA